MKMETSNISLVKGWPNVRRYGRKIASAVHSAIRQRKEPSSGGRTKSSRTACLEKERHQAQSLAQLQSTRFFR
jgi:hypothetical protein